MVNMFRKCLLPLALCVSLLFLPATAMADLGEMDYQPGERVVTITDEHQAVYEQLLAEASEGAQKNEGFWQFHRMDQLDERLRDDADTIRPTTMTMSTIRFRTRSAYRPRMILTRRQPCSSPMTI